MRRESLKFEGRVPPPGGIADAPREGTRPTRGVASSQSPVTPEALQPIAPGRAKHAPGEWRVDCESAPRRGAKIRQPATPAGVGDSLSHANPGLLRTPGYPLQRLRRTQEAPPWTSDVSTCSDNFHPGRDTNPLLATGDSIHSLLTSSTIHLLGTPFEGRVPPPGGIPDAPREGTRPSRGTSGVRPIGKSHHKAEDHFWVVGGSSGSEDLSATGDPTFPVHAFAHRIAPLARGCRPTRSRRGRAGSGAHLDTTSFGKGFGAAMSSSP
jgi:hypothetical protein